MIPLKCRYEVLRSAKSSTLIQFSVFCPLEEEEDTGHAVEEVEPSKRIFRSKDFIVGSVTCDAGFVYTVVMSNTCIFFYSVVLFYCVELSTKVTPCLQSSETRLELLLCFWTL